MPAAKLFGLLILLLGVSSIVLAVPDRPVLGDSASTSVTLFLPATHVTFPRRQLEVTLHEVDPRVRNREVLVDKLTIKGFTHQQGADTVRSVTLGFNQQIKPG